MSTPPKTIAELHELAQAYVPRAHAPYSGREEAAVALLSDGAWVPGVRVENASFSLSIPAVLNAVTTAVAAGRRDLVAIATTHEPGPEEHAYVKGLPVGPWRLGPSSWIMGTDELPAIGDAIDPFLHRAGSVVDAAIAAARQVAESAWVPESKFPVGCLLVAADGRALPGVNVEHPDWMSILCAERNAISTALTFGVEPLHALFLTCPRDPSATPCGACRQVLMEVAPDLVIWMDRASGDPERSTSRDLLPNAFTGTQISR